MATDVIMPQMGFDMREGTVVRWLKQEGDEITRGEAIAEIETDKATVELEAFVGGILGRVVVTEGTTVPVGEVIGIITAPGEAVPEKTTPSTVFCLMRLLSVMKPVASAQNMPATKAPTASGMPIM